VSDKRPKKDAVEVSSRPIQDELGAIKDRLSAIETIQSISNAPVVKQYVQEHLKTKDAQKIMKECEEPKTKSYLQTKFDYRSKQALDHHLKPLRDADLIREKVEADGTIVFEWSNLFRRLPKSAIRSILGDTK
jgi:nanoRNase/pAp phosphatase (c-di-AMP/oligoRNAs hydrolase)